jgi:hypothetical protein
MLTVASPGGTTEISQGQAPWRAAPGTCILISGHPGGVPEESRTPSGCYPVANPFPGVSRRKLSPLNPWLISFVLSGRLPPFFSATLDCTRPKLVLAIRPVYLHHKVSSLKLAPGYRFPYAQEK